ncbi:MAG: DUF4148 domain-containing protein [Paraburkholderia sp.]|jgi:hypothetical protein
MESLIKAVALAVVIAAPVASFAQSNQPVTRAQVRADLVQLELTGWRPGVGDDPHYPADIQTAEAKVAASNGATGIGGAANGSSDMGQPVVSKAAWNGMYSQP